VKEGYRKIIYRVIRKSEWCVYALGNKENISRELRIGLKNVEEKESIS
jgi:hypothetical protein